MILFIWIAREGLRIVYMNPFALPYVSHSPDNRFSVTDDILPVFNIRQGDFVTGSNILYGCNNFLIIDYNGITGFDRQDDYGHVIGGIDLDSVVFHLRDILLRHAAAVSFGYNKSPDS
jgi:hypothetical protein